MNDREKMRPTSVYVGGLSEDIQKEDLEREFSKFGNLIKIWVAYKPPGFAFIEFEDDQDANEAIKEMNGATINGSEIKVDLSRGRRGGRGRGRNVGFRRCHGGYDSGFRRFRGGHGGWRSFGNRSRGYDRPSYERCRSSGYRSRSPAGHSVCSGRSNRSRRSSDSSPPESYKEEEEPIPPYKPPIPRQIDPKVCSSRDSQQNKKSGQFPKVFLGGLPPNCTKTDIRSFFSRYGTHDRDPPQQYDQARQRNSNSYCGNDSIDRKDYASYASASSRPNVPSHTYSTYEEFLVQKILRREGFEKD